MLTASGGLGGGLISRVLRYSYGYGHTSHKQNCFTDLKHHLCDPMNTLVPRSQKLVTLLLHTEIPRQ